MNNREEVIRLLDGQKLRALYANTFYSLTDRIDETGIRKNPMSPDVTPGASPGPPARMCF